MKAGTKEVTRHVGAYVFTAKLPARVCRCGEALFADRDVGAFDDRVAWMLAEAGITTPEVLRFLRKAIGLQAQELAALLGVRPETVSRWEKGRGKIDRAAYAVLRQLLFDERKGGTSTSMAENLRSLLKPKRLPSKVQVRLAG